MKFKLPDIETYEAITIKTAQREESRLMEKNRKSVDMSIIYVHLIYSGSITIAQPSGGMMDILVNRNQLDSIEKGSGD